MMNLKDTMHFLAQGCINVTEGDEDGGREQREQRHLGKHGCFIAEKSPIHQALAAVCALLPPGEADVHFRNLAIVKTHGEYTVMLTSGTMGCCLATCQTRTAAESLVACLNTLADYFTV